MDRGRAQVYAAELAAFDGTELEAVVPIDTLVSLASRVTSGPWWSGPSVTVRASRSDARSSTTRSREGSAEVRIASAQRTPATLVHELAHALAGSGAGHGPRYRRAHVDVAVVAFDAERAGWLEVAYVDHGLPIGARTWPEPPAAAFAL
ncbi:MAG TPA: hypothetical protein VGK49_06330 [Ilumatobacteraceae bacterium]